MADVETPAQDDEFLTPSETMRLLKIGEHCFYAGIASGEIPSVRIGKHIRVRRAALTAELGRQVQSAPGSKK